ncbi:putative PepSY-like beta-lactamase-inhibitor [Pontibacter ummariensis]|uniref:Putative beta-lactamase-inhibitor-like, PepSY-like n=1 Tax=Pontibacter ummariensis TaxID=1610492 RepID=A0A239IYT9_9BACT|nr:PepSY-like domain-containing protein [Pontibacter ummariensis]PRY09015.1 putative PepSY-like beta-lactamase-inhibitor [Pontibacter ummariensis]SNS98378.1 Putative beta-lactamase-inhibitor-like, PepSY-like [Pontibacter ummariensis]
MKLPGHFLLLLSLFLLSCNNDDDDVAPNDVPEAVKSTLTASFSNAMNVEWEKVGDNYVAEFEVTGNEYDALIDPSGQLLLYKYDIPESELPDAVSAAIHQNYSDGQIDDAERLYQGNAEFYQVDLDNKGTGLHLVFSPDGQEQTEPAYWD